MYKGAIIGVGGGRARSHGDAFQFVKRGRLAAVSSRDREKLDAFGDEFGVGPRYAGSREMLDWVEDELILTLRRAPG